jgi:effector-binding domain-containing protein
MDVEIHNEPISFDLHGVSGDVPDRNYAMAGSRLMESLWPPIKEKGVKNTGINYWIYRGATRLSTCVELIDNDRAELFEHIPVRLEKYAYYKHIGPYERLGEAYAAIKREVAELGLALNGDNVEKYGHWTDDQSKLETEIFAGLR